MDKVEIGDTIRIDYMEGESDYNGRTGIVKFIDDIGQIHGDWGGCAVVPNIDSFTILKKRDK